jgi:hypothetical protein
MPPTTPCHDPITLRTAKTTRTITTTKYQLGDLTVSNLVGPLNVHGSSLLLAVKILLGLKAGNLGVVGDVGGEVLGRQTLVKHLLDLLKGAALHLRNHEPDEEDDKDGGAEPDVPVLAAPIELGGVDKVRCGEGGEPCLQIS